MAEECLSIPSAYRKCLQHKADWLDVYLVPGEVRDGFVNDLYEKKIFPDTLLQRIITVWYVSLHIVSQQYLRSRHQTVL